jgi:hypothetical protein
LLCPQIAARTRKKKKEKRKPRLSYQQGIRHHAPPPLKKKEKRINNTFLFPLICLQTTFAIFSINEQIVTSDVSTALAEEAKKQYTLEAVDIFSEQ